MFLSFFLVLQYSERKAHGEHNCEHTKEDKCEMATHKKKLKKHQKERKVIIMKITSNQRAVHSFLKKGVA
jgi:hypothetical protein